MRSPLVLALLAALAAPAPAQDVLLTLTRDRDARLRTLFLDAFKSAEGRAALEECRSLRALLNHRFNDALVRRALSARAELSRGELRLSCGWRLSVSHYDTNSPTDRVLRSDGLFPEAAGDLLRHGRAYVPAKVPGSMRDVSIPVAAAAAAARGFSLLDCAPGQAACVLLVDRRALGRLPPGYDPERALETVNVGADALSAAAEAALEEHRRLSEAAREEQEAGARRERAAQTLAEFRRRLEK